MALPTRIFWVERGQVEHILTGNGETNGHMIGINETLGYRVIGPPERTWELPAAQVIGPAQS